MEVTTNLKRMLALSGGGMRGVFQAVLLQNLEKDCNCFVADLFGYVAGTSTGSIIAAAVAARKRMELVVQLFSSNGRDIFARTWRPTGPFSRIPPYNPDVLTQQLSKVLENTKLKDLETKIYIPATQINPIENKLFSNTEPGQGELLLSDVVRASCSAPSYFTSHTPTSSGGRAYVDGGLWANDPSSLLLRSIPDVSKDASVRLLSIGNGFTASGIEPRRYNSFNTFELIKPTIDIMFRCQETATESQCTQLMRERYKLLNTPLQAPIPLDDFNKSIEVLVPAAHAYWDKHREEVLDFLGITK